MNERRENGLFWIYSLLAAGLYGLANTLLAPFARSYDSLAVATSRNLSFAVTFLPFIILLYRRDRYIFIGLTGGASFLIGAAAMGASGLYCRLRAQCHLETGVIGAIIVGCQASAIVFFEWFNRKRAAKLFRSVAGSQRQFSMSPSEMLAALIVLLISCCFSLLKGKTSFLAQDVNPSVGCAWAVSSGIFTAFGLCLLCSATETGSAVARAWVWEVLIGVIALCMLLSRSTNPFHGNLWTFTELIKLGFYALPAMLATVFYILATEVDKGLSKAAVVETTSVIWTAFFASLILGEAIGLGQSILIVLALMAVVWMSRETSRRKRAEDALRQGH